MKRFLYITLFFMCTSIYSQNASIEKYHRAKIYYSSKEDLNKLSKLGLAVDHGHHKKNNFIISDFPQSQIETAKNNGNSVELIIEDVKQFYLDQNNPQSSRYVSNNNATANAFCEENPITNYETPVNYNNGTMGGFLTYDEMIDELDEMKALYPDLISSRSDISTFTTEEGRKIQYVKISDNPSSNESASESQILYTAVHHAREATTLQQTIFYMWYLLENYSTSDEIKSIVDNSELFFVPCLNPDGYIYNQTTNPNGGGLWRKNRSQNAGGSRGVDLNRNYSYITPNGDEVWNTSGTSGPPGDTYPGTHPFSEPETQAIRWLVEQNNFKIAINAHSFSKLLLFPFGYVDNKPTPENDLYNAISKYMVKDNNYNNILASGLYELSGSSDDFMYDMLKTTSGGTRNKIYAMTPEIGDSFWPAESEIISICKSMLFLNIAAAQIDGNLANIEEKPSSVFIETTAANVNYEIESIGFESPSNFEVSILPVSTNIISVGQPQDQNNMSLLEKRTGNIAINLKPTIATGEEVIYDLVVNNGLFNRTVRVNKIFGITNTILDEPGDDISDNWGATDWGISTTVYKSPPSAITDSPNGNYGNAVDNAIELAEALDLTRANFASLSFYARWDIADGFDFDFVQLQVSRDDGDTWIPQCGKYTVADIFDEPIYEGTQNEWVYEEIDLSDYLGNTIKIRFLLFTDTEDTEDGFYFDDLAVKIIDDTLSTPDYISNNFSIYPNPIKNTLQINSSLSNYKYEIYDIRGQLIGEKDNNNHLSKIDCSTIASGMYLLKIEHDNKTKTFKFIKE